nr:glycosyl hydrolase family 8 [Limimaricola litoreus]
MIAAPAVARAAAVFDSRNWQDWRARFLMPEGRVIDDYQGDISHSEGQAWALLFAVAAGDRETFDAIRGWTNANLAVRRDPLLAWRYVPGESAAARDYNNASDGDLFYAWALLRGGRRFGDAEALEQGGQVARGVMEICIAEDPRQPGRHLLLPAAEHFRGEGHVTLNPSYIMPRALHELAAAYDLPILARAAEDGAGLLEEVAQRGLPPDWLGLDARGWIPADGPKGQFGYDAIRVPLYLVWSGRAGHPLVRRAAQLWAQAGQGTPVQAARDGAVLHRDGAPGYEMLARTVLRATDATSPPPLLKTMDGQSYYPATLGLLSELVAHDIGLMTS